MKCWICGAAADSGEHLVKASDLRVIFGTGVTQKSPLYLHNSVRRNVPIGGIKSDKLKYKARICSYCNNERTQPYDKAWEQLSNYLQKREPPIRPGMVVRLDHVFPGGVRKSMLHVHLFFLKHFGCMIAEHAIPLDLDVFAQSILTESAHANVHLALWTGLEKKDKRQVGRTHVQAAELNGKVAFAAWLYIVDRVAVNVIYALPLERRKALVNSWHPETVGKCVRIIGV